MTNPNTSPSSYPEEGPGVGPCWAGIHNMLGHDDDDDNTCYGQDLTFPGPLLNSKMEKEPLMTFIQKKSQEILHRVDEPEQIETYFFWKIMELFCNCKGTISMLEVAILLFKVYSFLRSKAPKFMCDETRHDWCLPLARLLCKNVPDEEKRQAVLQMSAGLACRGQHFAAHICCVVAQMELGTSDDSSFDLIGCYRLPVKKSAIREAIERSEVYEYVLFMTSGFAQLSFQKYKVLHTYMLSKEGSSAVALDYLETIARAVISCPSISNETLMEQIILISEKLQEKAEEPKWMLELRRLHASKVQQRNKTVVCLANPEKDEEDDLFPVIKLFQCHENTGFPPSPIQLKTTPEEELFESRYTVGELLGEGTNGCVYAGVRKADEKMVAIKYVAKSPADIYITIPGETGSLPLEVALMKMASRPLFCSKKVVELLEWVDMSSYTVLVMERPSPCIDLREFCRQNNGRLDESVAQAIIWQVAFGAQHCCDRGVFHRDITAGNVLINTETMQVKLIDFGCGDLMTDTPYTTDPGTPAYWPPEFIQFDEYMGRPATVWSLGVLMFLLVCGDFPFKTKEEIANADLLLPEDLSEDCQYLISWCLMKDPYYRATLEDVINHEWFAVNKVQIHADEQQWREMEEFIFDPENNEGDDMFLAFKGFQLDDCTEFRPSPMQLRTTPEGELFESQYLVGELLGEGAFGCVYAGVRKADEKMVAIKYVAKSPADIYITIPGETDSLPLEVALMKMASRPPVCKSVVELLEWVDMSSCIVLVMERPSPCLDLREFCRQNNGRLDESAAQALMWQVAFGAQHCCDRGVFHRDITAGNVLINTETMQVKLIDFGCGDLMTDTPYTTDPGTPAYRPPEFIQFNEYMGRPATVWSLGVLMFLLVCGDYPFKTKDQIADAYLLLPDHLSRDCQDLLSWCLMKDPYYRATLEDIINHEWFAVNKVQARQQGLFEEYFKII